MDNERLQIIASLVLGLVPLLLRTAKSLYDFVAQVKGEQEIPSWDKLLADNAALQAKIDAEKGGSG